MPKGIEEFSKGLHRGELQQMLNGKNGTSEESNKKILKSIDKILEGQERRQLETYKLDFPLLGKELNAVPKKNEIKEDYKNRMKIIEEGFADTAEGYLLKKEDFDKIDRIFEKFNKPPKNPSKEKTKQQPMLFTAENLLSENEVKNTLNMSIPMNFKDSLEQVNNQYKMVSMGPEDDLEQIINKYDMLSMDSEDDSKESNDDIENSIKKDPLMVALHPKDLQNIFTTKSEDDALRTAIYLENNQQRENERNQVFLSNLNNTSNELAEELNLERGQRRE